jgi:Ca2+-binding RTX toxin-like protein
MAHFSGTALNDSLTGTWASDQIDGGAGADTMTGGGGDDVYIVDNVNDVVIEYTLNQYPLNQVGNTAIQLASVNAAGVLGNDTSGALMTAISGDGNLVVYYSRANNLLPIDTNGYSPDIDVKNMTTGQVVSAHTTSANTQPTTGQGGGPEADYNSVRITPDGRYVAFVSTSVGLIPSVDSATDADIFVKDLQTGQITIESQATGGVSKYHSSGPDISADARYLVFTSMDNLVGPIDANGSADTDVFMRDRQTGQLVLVSGLADGSVQGSGGGGGSDSWGASVSDDGKWVLFQSSATNLDTSVVDTNNGTDVFLKNMTTGVISNLTARGWDGSATHGSSYDAAMTPDGKYAVFYSGSGNLVAPDNYGNSGIFRMDLTTHAIVRVDTLASGVTVGYGQHPQITPDGRYVVFTDTVETLVPVTGGSTVYSKVFVKDMVTGAIDMVSRTETGGALTVYSAYAPQISDDGRFIVFNTRANLVAGDTGTNDDVYRVPNPLYSPADKVVASVDYTLPANVENLTLAGAPGVNLRGTGNELDNILISGANSDTLLGMAGNDTFVGGAGNDTFDGGTGVDTTVYGGNRADFTLTKISTGYTLTDTKNSEGTDTLLNIERVKFGDKLIAIDLLPNGHTAQALEFIGIVAPSLLSSPSVVSLILSFFDRGSSLHDVCQTAIDVGLISSVAGSGSNAALAAMVYRNIFGSEADGATVDWLAGFMDGRSGSYSQADFMAIVSELDVNQMHINLVGLQQTGIELG